MKFDVTWTVLYSNKSEVIAIWLRNIHTQFSVHAMTHVSNTSTLSVKLAYSLGVVLPHGTLITAPIMRDHQLQLDVQLSEFSNRCSISALAVGARIDDALCLERWSVVLCCGLVFPLSRPEA